MALLRVATYNINCCRDYIDAWGDKSPRAIADFIEKEQIEICGLNEVDINSERSLGYNQPEYVIDKLEELTGETYYSCFAAGLDGYHPPFDKEYAPTQGKALYGNAIISKYPIVNYRTVKVALEGTACCDRWIRASCISHCRGEDWRRNYYGNMYAFWNYEGRENVGGRNA